MKKTKIVFLVLFIGFILSSCYKVKYEIIGPTTIAERVNYSDFFNKDVQITDVQIPWEKTVWIPKAKEGPTTVNFSADFYHGDDGFYEGNIYSNGYKLLHHWQHSKSGRSSYNGFSKKNMNID
jgi:hypothetical protein